MRFAATVRSGGRAGPGDGLLRRPHIRDEVLRWARRHLSYEASPAEVAEHVNALVGRQPALTVAVLQESLALPEPVRSKALWWVLLVERMFMVQYGDVATQVPAAEVRATRAGLRGPLSGLGGVHARLLGRRPELSASVAQRAVLALALEALESRSAPGGTVLPAEQWLRVFSLMALASEVLDLGVDAGLRQRDRRRALYAEMEPAELFRELQEYARFPPKELMAQLMGLPRPLTPLLLPWVEAMAERPWATDLPGWGWGPVHAIRLLSTWQVPAALPHVFALFDAATAPDAPMDDPRELPVELSDALARWGELALEPTLEAIRAAGPGRPYRAREVLLVTVATSLGVLDPRIRSLLAAIQDRDPIWWAERVAAYGDPSLLPVLRSRMRVPQRRTGEQLGMAELEAIHGAIEALEAQEGPPTPCQSDILAFYNRRTPPGPDLEPTKDPSFQRTFVAAGLARHLPQLERPASHVPELRLLLPDDEI